MSIAANGKPTKYTEIIHAALEVFALHGFHEAKIADIADKAGIAASTIYQYFKNKDDLLISVFENQVEWVNEQLQAALADIPHDPEKKLRRLVRFHLELAVNNPHLAAFITIEIRRSAVFVKKYAKAQFAAYLNGWAQVIDEGKAAGVFREDIGTSLTKHMMFGALDHICVTWLKRSPDNRTLLLDQEDSLSTLFLSAIRVAESRKIS